MTDTLKTSTVGVAAAAVSGLGILPDVVSVAVGVMTFVYLTIKIDSELKERKKRKR